MTHELSRSFEIDGRETLLPTIDPLSKQQLSDEETVDAYMTGRTKPLGIFGSPEEATEFAKRRSETSLGGALDPHKFEVEPHQAEPSIDISDTSKFEVSEAPTASSVTAHFLGQVNKLAMAIPQLGVNGMGLLLESAGLIDAEDIPDLAKFFNETRLDGTTNELGAPRNAEERAAAHAGTFFFNTLASAMGLSAAAAGGAGASATGAATVNLGKAGERIMQRIFDPIRNSPSMTAFYETLGALSGGVAGGTAKEMGGGPLGTFAAEAVGVMAPHAVPKSLIGKLAGVILPRLKPGRVEKDLSGAANKAANRVVTHSLDNKVAQQNIDEATARSEQFGTNLTVAESSKSPALVAEQRRIESMAKGDELNAMVERKIENVGAVQAQAEKLAPSSDGSMPAVVDTAQRRVDNLRMSLGAQADDITDKRIDLANQLPSPNRANRGAELRGTFYGLRDVVREDVNQMARDLDLDEATFDSKPLLETVGGMFKRVSRFEDVKLPKVAKDLKAIDNIRQNHIDLARQITNAKRRLGRKGINKRETAAINKHIKQLDGQLAKSKAANPETETFTFMDLKALRERVSDDLLNTLGAAQPDRKMGRSLVLLRREIDGYLDTLANQGGKTAENWKQFRQFYRDEYIARFERSLAYKVSKRDKQGAYRVEDEKVASMFFERGNITGARQYKQTFGNEPTATKAMHDIVLDNVRLNVVDPDGTINPTKLSSWIKKHESVLDEFPAIKRKLTNKPTAENPEAAPGFVELNDALLTRNATLLARQRKVEATLLTKQLASKTTPGEATDVILHKAMTDPRLMRELAASTRGKPEGEALKKAVWDDALNKLGDEDGIPIPQALNNYINKHENSLRVVFTDQHLNNLRRISQALDDVLATRVPTGSAGFESMVDRVQGALGSGPLQISSRIFAAQQGRVSGRIASVDLFSRFMINASKKQFDAAMKEMLFDEGLAKSMVGMMKTKVGKKQYRDAMGAFYFALGIDPIDLTAPIPNERGTNEPDQTPAVLN